MSEEEKAPKKAARKRVVKKGVRGTRAPRKKTIVKKEEAPAEESGVEQENPSSEDSEITYALESDSPVEPKAEAAEAATEIEVVEDAPAKPQNERSRKQPKGEAEKSKPSADSSEEKSDEEGGEKSEGRNRRGRNRRGGNNREDSSARGRAIDKDEAALKAWEIYQAELEEEGVSLVDPRRAREVARRCLELATVFCEERDRYLER